MTSSIKTHPLLEEVSSAIIDLSPNPLMVLDKTGKCLWCNKAMYELFEITEREIVGKRINQLNSIYDTEKPKYIKMLAEMIHGKERAEFSTRLKLPDGNEYNFCVVTDLLVRNDETRVILVTLMDRKIHSDTTMDETEESFHSEILDQSEYNLDLLRAILESAYGGILVVDKDGKMLFSNEKFVGMWNIHDDLLKTKDDSKLLEHVFDQLVNPKEFLDKVQDLYNSSDESIDFIELIDGRIFERISHPLSKNTPKSGRVWRFRDVTEDRITKTSMRASDQRYRELMDNVPGGVAIADNDNRFVYVNPAFLRILQYEKDEILGMSVYDTIIPEHHSRMIDESRKRVSGISSSYEIVMITKNGDRKITSLSAVPQRDDSGQIIGSIGLFIDNTERNLALDALSKSEQHYRELISQLPVGVALVALDEKLELVNEALANILGVPLEDLHMRQFTDFMSLEDTERIHLQTKSRLRGDSSIYEVDIMQPSGNRRTLRISAAPNMNDDGVIVGTLGIMEDVSEQKRNEQLLLVQEREIDLYGSLLRHDIRNDLGIVASYIEAVMLLTQLVDEPAVFMNSALSTIMRISNLLSGFGRPQELKERNLQEYFHFIADEAMESYEKLTISIETNENADEVNIAAGTLLSLVFQNLIRNTTQHVKDSPEIKMSIQRRHNMAQVILQDNGTGIPPEMLDRLFQRGVSTKGESGGLGLHLCKEIMNSKGGKIELLPPEEGKGAAFLIEIPIIS